MTPARVAQVTRVAPVAPARRIRGRYRPKKRHKLNPNHNPKPDSDLGPNVNPQTMMKVKMTPEEAHAKVIDLMEQIDEDMDGVVSVHELREWVKKERAKKAIKVKFSARRPGHPLDPLVH